MTKETFDRLSCDRCGSTVETQATGGRASPHGWVQATSCAFGAHDIDNGSTVDLCPDCRGSLTEWMRDGKVAAERGFVPLTRPA